VPKFFSKFISQCFRKKILKLYFRKILETFWEKSYGVFNEKKVPEFFGKKKRAEVFLEVYFEKYSQNLFSIVNTIIIYIFVLCFMFLWANNKPHRGAKGKIKKYGVEPKNKQKQIYSSET
jgi:hypothetical protein